MYNSFGMKLYYIAGCEYYMNLLYPVRVVGKAFRAVRIIRSDGYIDTIAERDWKKFRHYPLCFQCYHPSMLTWVWCIHNTVSPCRLYTEDCKPFTISTLIHHIARCSQPACIQMRTFLENRELWRTLVDFA